MRRIFGSSFCAGARCAPKIKDGVLPIKIHSAINIVWPSNSDSLLNTNSYRK